MHANSAPGVGGRDPELAAGMASLLSKKFPMIPLFPVRVPLRGQKATEDGDGISCYVGSTSGFAVVQRISYGPWYGPLASSNGCEVWAHVLEVVYTGVVMNLSGFQIKSRARSTYAKP